MSKFSRREMKPGVAREERGSIRLTSAGMNASMELEKLGHKVTQSQLSLCLNSEYEEGKKEVIQITFIHGSMLSIHKVDHSAWSYTCHTIFSESACLTKSSFTGIKSHLALEYRTTQL